MLFVICIVLSCWIDVPDAQVDKVTDTVPDIEVADIPDGNFETAVRWNLSLAKDVPITIVKDKSQNYKTGFTDLVMQTCCGLHNFRLNFRPWCYKTTID